MGFNQIGFAGQPGAPRSYNPQQNIGQPVPTGAFGQSQLPQVYGNSVPFALAPGEVALLPEGQWISFVGPYCDVQYWDQASQIWRVVGIADSAPFWLSADGTNYRFANLSGCVVGAAVTAAGTAGSLPVSMYTPTGVYVGGVFTAQTTLGVSVTPSAGGATFNTFIGGAVSTTTTGWITNAGTGYTVAPKLLVLPPASQGSQPFIPATMVATISGGAITAVTVTNQGAGYVAPPTVLVLNQPGDTTGASGAITIPTTSMVGAGQVTAIVMATPGTALTAVPTLTLAGASLPAGATAVALMNFSIEAGGTATAGTGYTAGYQFVAYGGNYVGGQIYTNPAIETGIIVSQQPNIGIRTGTTVVTIAAASIQFGGTGFQVIPSLVGVGIGATALGGIATPVVGGYNDVCFLQPI